MRELPNVLALDVAGNPTRWIDYETSAYYYAKDMIAWSLSPIEFTIYGGTNAKTGERSFLNINTIIALKGKIRSHKGNYARRTPPLTNRALFRRDRNVCAYCGNVFKVEELTRDHIIPKAQNGKNVWTNVVSACSGCNKFKEDRTPEQANMKLLFVPYTPNRAEWLILENRRILVDQMDFLMKKVPKNSRLHIS